MEKLTYVSADIIHPIIAANTHNLFKKKDNLCVYLTSDYYRDYTIYIISQVTDSASHIYKTTATELMAMKTVNSDLITAQDLISDSV